MDVNELELRGLLNEMLYNDIVIGMFMVFDNVMNGFTISENNEFLTDNETGELRANINSRIISMSGGIFHLFRHKNDNNKTFLIVGNLLNIFDTDTHLDVKEAIQIVLDFHYSYYEDDKQYYKTDDDENSSIGIAVFDWEDVNKSLKNKKHLKSILTKISRMICRHEDFLVNFGNDNGFVGLGSNVLENDDYTDGNLELLFAEFIKFINRNILPRIEIQ